MAAPEDAERGVAVPSSKWRAPASRSRGIVRALAASRLFRLSIVAAFARLLTFGNPILHVDEQFYFAVAHAMLRGAVPYVDVWDRKPIGLFLLYLPAAATGPAVGIYVYQAMAFAAATATAGVVAALADRAGWRRGSFIAASVYLLWLDLADGQGGQAPVFYNLLVVSAVFLSGPSVGARASDVYRRRNAIGAMALLGLALQIKYSCVFEGVFIGLWLVREEWRRRSPGIAAAYGLLLAAVALLPTAIAAFFYRSIGYEHAFVFANFTSIFLRAANPWTETAFNFLTVSVTLAPLLAMAFAGRRTGDADLQARCWRGLLGGWLVSALTGLLLLGGWFDHYALPAMVPASCCAAGFLGDTARGRMIALPILVVAAIAGQAMTIGHLLGRGTATQFRALTDAIGRGPGCLYVYAPEPMLYAMTDRCTVTRFLFPDHLSRAREHGAIGADQATELRHVFSVRPAVVVFGHYRGERPDMYALVAASLRAEGYILRAVEPLGDQRLQVFKRRDAA